MKLPRTLTIPRAPDFVIGQPDAPYLRRWWIIPRNRFFNIYLHNILRSDDDRAFHDHPWASCSIILKGGYWEHTPYFDDARFLYIPEFEGKATWKLWRGPGSVKFRRASAAHRLELGIDWIPKYPGPLSVGYYGSESKPNPCWTIFITGPRIREWGFHCPKGWRHWRDFIGVKAGEAKGSEQGPGCGEQ